ncbi:bifunctional aminoglycoside phosphotransferase/ATP-binding protein [Starkeya sp. ORNL1]|uniref:bifunctional aminoglycoside phosphotransferase/ATP-binding protein n=1 Tax=Starkeya sp. ORNL1 TaxID=2709380 RepID=UPI001FEDC0F1|nr:bifunctional aminoglycoside phosphotransferase/ATP-binding protein [Starkeya sp. ORNL1]
MPSQDQGEAIAFLNSAAAFGGEERDVRTIVTHISIVLLIGARAIKLKRAVRLPYVDFSTAERRLATCEQELRLNRRTAPMLYRAVRRITREPDGRLALDGKGVLVDAVIEMARFDESGLFDRMALAGALTPPLMTKLAGGIAAFHAGAAIAADCGGAAPMAAVLDINERVLAMTEIFPRDDVVRLIEASRAALAAHAARLDTRAGDGKVRRCHGDLHLRNICLVDGEPTLFDCLEFDEELATTDVLYDLAFLLMDLWHRGMEGYANLVFNRYLDEADEEDGLPALPLFMAVRATVRAHVTAAQVADAGAEATARREEAHAYFALALRLLDPRPARLVAVGGLSGSGKSTLAAALAPGIGPAPGARILATDRIRKRLFGVAAETRLPPDAYRPNVSGQVYGILAARAESVLSLGHGVVADAVFDRPDDRSRIADLASSAGVAFHGLWLEASPERLLRRVADRRNDASDATPDVVKDQLGRPLGAIQWPRLIADGDMGAIRAAATRIIDDEI